MPNSNTRDIWIDVVDAIDQLRKETDLRSQDNFIDPRVRIVGEPYDYPAEEIWIDSLDWDDIEFGYQGPVPQKNERCPNEEELTSLWREFVFDKCAWYRSFHYLPRDMWGIHVNEDCWLETARQFYRDGAYATWNNSIKGAFMYIFLHEFFHYIVDISSSVIELISHNPTVYETYSKRVYSPSFGTNDCLEEALANRFLYGRTETIRLDRDYLYLILKAQPPGYSMFVDYLGSGFWKGRRTLMNEIKNCSIRTFREEPLEQLIELLTPWHYSHGHRVRIWLHRPPKAPKRITFPKAPIPSP